MSMLDSQDRDFLCCYNYEEMLEENDRLLDIWECVCGATKEDDKGFTYSPAGELLGIECSFCGNKWEVIFDHWELVELDEEGQEIKKFKRVWENAIR